MRSRDHHYTLPIGSIRVKQLKRPKWYRRLYTYIANKYARLAQNHDRELQQYIESLNEERRLKRKPGALSKTMEEIDEYYSKNSNMAKSQATRQRRLQP